MNSDSGFLMKILIYIKTTLSLVYITQKIELSMLLETSGLASKQVAQAVQERDLIQT